MKRKIKFRAKTRINGDTVESMTMSNGATEDTKDCYFFEIKIDIWEEVIPETIGQFIGISDKNGIGIYEGDYSIDRYPVDEEDLSKGYHESLLPVVWCDKQLMWCVDTSFAKDGSYLTSLVEYFGEFLEIKGNIYESKN